MLAVAKVLALVLSGALLASASQATAHVAHRLDASARTKRICCSSGYAAFKTFITVANDRRRDVTVDCSVLVFNPDGTLLSGVTFDDLNVPAKAEVTYRKKWTVYLEDPYNENEKYATGVRHCHRHRLTTGATQPRPRP